jgi:signal transduction histidine kinase
VKLHSRIYLHSLAVLVVIVVLTTLVFIVSGRNAPAREIAGRLAHHAATLAGDHLDDPRALARVLERLHEHLGVDVAVRDLSGRVLAAAGERLPTAPADMDAAARAGRVTSRLHPATWALAPVRDGAGRVAGTAGVVVHRHMGPPRLTGPLVTVAIVLVVIAVATRPLARRIARPLERLTAAARRLAAGDLAARVGATADGRERGHRVPEEIAELTGAFNDMAERVERLVRGQKELLANVSHELRSPLARIRMAIELLPRTGDADARFRDIETDLAELDRLIEDVLTTARLEATGLPTALGPVDLRALLAGLATRATHDPAVAGTPVRVTDGPPVTLTGDERLLRRAVWNLVENAAKYGAPPITIDAAVVGPHVVIGVSDEGPGIPAEARERVLAPFYRLDVAHTPGGAARGFGLGLTLARRVAEAHGGSIALGPARVADGREVGCRVTLTLPSGARPARTPLART